MIQWQELYIETAEGQTSFIKPGDFPDIPSEKNCAVYYDGRKLLPGSYEVQCDGALVVVSAPFPAGVEIAVVYTAQERS